MHDFIVVGSGPNGLAAAIRVARSRHSVLVLEAADTLGGGMRSAELTLPGFVHDVCAAVVPLASGSPWFGSLPLADFGLRLVHPPAPLAHPLDDGTAVLLERSVARTAAGLGRDAAAYANLIAPLVAACSPLLEDILGPLRWPRHPLPLVRFGLAGLLPAVALAGAAFREPRAKALLAGLSAHSMLPLERPLSAAVGLVLGMLGHAVGWPIVRGGTQKLADALAGYLVSLGGETRTRQRVDSLAELPSHRSILLDLAPARVLDIASAHLPRSYTRKLARYRYGPGVFKIDWALDAPIPWTAPACGLAATVHLGGTLEEIAAAERGVWRGIHPSRPFVILVQPTLFDATRAPDGRHTAWAYCHVPNASSADMTRAIEAQVERFAPGFGRSILARSTHTATQMQTYNPNYVGGDINGGVQDLLQLWTRPVARPVPYTTPNPALFLCSSSTPPGGGVHGMCGFHAAGAALSRLTR